jgi:hypothetical protein
MSKFSFIAGLLTFVLMPYATHAAFQWDINPAEHDVLSIKLQNWEPSPAQVAADGFLYGIGRVTSIENVTSGDLAWSPGAMKEITFIFNNFAFDAVNSTGTNLLFTGGDMSVYFDSTPDTDGAIANKLAGTNAAPDPSGNFSNGDLLLTLVGNSGIDAFGHTLSATFNAAGTNGTGFGFLDVTGGSLQSSFNSSAMPTDNGGFADFRFTTTLQASGAVPANYQVFSNDPLNGVYNVPEATTLTIWGLLAGFAGVVAYRRRAKA